MARCRGVGGPSPELASLIILLGIKTQDGASADLVEARRGPGIPASVSVSSAGHPGRWKGVFALTLDGPPEFAPSGNPHLTAPIIALPEAGRYPGLVGGKALALGMLASSYPVPPGFVITSPAMAALFSEERRLADEVSASVRHAFQRLQDERAGPVAVRSSGTDEDGAALSFAGQYETILGVTDEAGLFVALRRCWASFFGERARLYAAQHGNRVRGGFAVLVQSLVAAEAAGVAFSLDPVTGAGDEVFITASWGLGQTVVDGLVIPDTFRVHKRNGWIRRELGDKDMALVCRDGVTEERPVAPENRHRYCLDDPQVRAVADLVCRLEAHFGGGVDVEFAVADGRLHLLQVRPITGSDASPS